MALTDGLVACWDLNEASGNRVDHVNPVTNTLTPVNNPGSVEGKFGAAVRFVRGNQQYLYRPAALEGVLLGAFTVSLWVRPLSIATGSAGIMTNGTSTAGGTYDFLIITLAGSNQVLVSFNRGNGGVLTSTAGLTLDVWQHLLIWRTFDVLAAGTLSLQIDHGAVQAVNFSSAMTTGNTQFNLGAIGGSGAAAAEDSYFDGDLDAVMVWDRVLSETERTLLWNNGQGIDCTFGLAACEPLPSWIAYGATGGPEWGTALFAAPGGWEQRTQLWSQVRGRWDVSFINVSKAQATTLVDFFRSVAWGKAGSFCFMDWRDHTFANVIGTGDGTTSTFQLVKVYTSGTLSYARPLSRPVVSSLVVTVNGVGTTAYTVDSTGRLVFAAPPPSGAVIHASGAFEVLVRFDTDSLQVTCVAPDIFSCAGLGLVELIGE